MRKKYIAIREAERYPGEDKTLEVIASSNLKELSTKVGEAAIPFGNDETVLVIPYSRTVDKMLFSLSARSHRTPIMRRIKERFESDYGYKQYWRPHTDSEERNKKTPTFCFLNFPRREHDLVVGLLYAHFNVIATKSLAEYTNSA